MTGPIAKIAELDRIYQQFFEKAHAYTQDAICKAGCAFCCTGTGTIDVTTLEGLRILRHIRTFPGALQKNLEKSIAKDRKNRELSRKSSCPFLNKKRNCSIYDVRPFVCRRLYSLADCHPQGPTLHKEVVEMGARTRDQLQVLDSNGYSGHISFILHLFGEPGFRETYCADGFDPSAIMAYGKAHKLVIHRSVQKG